MMKKVFEYIKRYKIRIAVICSILFLICIYLLSVRIQDDIIQHKVISSTVVYDIRGNGRSPGELLFGKFYVNGIQYIVCSSIHSGYDFRGDTLPFIYSSKNPNNNHFLATPDDFKRYNVPFPDSLYWIKELLDK
jgi:hypothetical protein